MLESLPAEQQPIAQQLLRGGIPAVRTALHFERERAREEGRPEPSTEGVLTIAESLVSRVKAAEWRDRAEAALKGADDLAMRDLRSLVSGSDVARDEASRELVVALREMLERRVEAHRTTWADEVTKHLDEGHVLRALRLSARPPDPGARFSAELATRLRDAASQALSPAAPSDKWLAVLLAVVDSPVRRTVKPEGLPAKPTPELIDTARQQCGRVPALAPLLGLSVPPPPGPARPHAPTKPPTSHATRRGVARPSRPATPSGRSARPASGTQSSPVEGPTASQAVAEVEEVAEPTASEAVAEPTASEAVAEPTASEAVAEVTEVEQPSASEAAEVDEPEGSEAMAEVEDVAEPTAVDAVDAVGAVAVDAVAVDAVAEDAEVEEPSASEEGALVAEAAEVQDVAEPSAAVTGD